MSGGRHRPSYLRPRARWYWRWSALPRRAFGIGLVVLVFAATSLVMDSLTAAEPSQPARVAASSLRPVAIVTHTHTLLVMTPDSHSRSHHNLVGTF